LPLSARVVVSPFFLSLAPCDLDLRLGKSPRNGHGDELKKNTTQAFSKECLYNRFLSLIKWSARTASSFAIFRMAAESKSNIYLLFYAQLRFFITFNEGSANGLL
jgi:hypothetical protein